MIRVKRKRVGQIGAVLSLVFLVWYIYTPIPFAYLKITSLLSILFLLIWVGTLNKIGRWISALISVFALTVWLWPAKSPDAADLRSRYQSALISYRNTPYVWGGENARGIDCSGLIRRAMIDALLSAGWQNKNPTLWRETAQVWWYDCSAREMKNGYSGRIHPVSSARSLNALETSQVQIGDLAVLKSGVHVLAYLGDGSWIQADPNLVNGGDKVIVTKAPSLSGWFGQRVVICRWRLLS